MPLHVFALPRTDLGGSVLGFNGAALLDRPASMLKDNLRDYRRLGLYVESRIRLRKALARFWARGNADDSIERSMRPQIENRPLEDLEYPPRGRSARPSVAAGLERVRKRAGGLRDRGIASDDVGQAVTRACRV